MGRSSEGFLSILLLEEECDFDEVLCDDRFDEDDLSTGLEDFDIDDDDGACDFDIDDDDDDDDEDWDFECDDE